MLQIFHETAYRYSQQVVRSSHRLRLRPLVDAQQSLVDWKLDLSVDGERWEYEDVFGNQVTALEVSAPFEELVIRSSSLVRVHIAAPEPLRTAPGRDRLPLAWMPWQRQLMLPYLLPPELPESELMALRDFALGFVERNASDLLATLQDMNATLYRDFAYVPGITNTETTPFEVFVARKGVCQDFAHLLIKHFDRLRKRLEVFEEFGRIATSLLAGGDLFARAVALRFLSFDLLKEIATLCISCADGIELGAIICPAAQRRLDRVRLFADELDVEHLTFRNAGSETAVAAVEVHHVLECDSTDVGVDRDDVELGVSRQRTQKRRTEIRRQT